MTQALTEQQRADTYPLPAAVCPACGRTGLTGFSRVDRIPVHNSLIMATYQEARDFPRGDLELGFCESCAFITNVRFDIKNVDYSPKYEDQQIFSPTFVKFQHDVVAKLIEKYDLRNKTIIEIGCGKGDFLQALCAQGDNRGIGIDPTSLNGRLTGPGADRVTFIQDLYSEKYIEKQADVIVCRHSLEHIPDVAAFLATVRRSIGDRLETIVFFELPENNRVLKETAYWDVYYEHCSYFSPGSLARLFRSNGFEVTNIELGFDDQYLLLEAKPVAQPSAKVLPVEETVEDVRKAVEHYASSLRRKLEYWRNHIREMRDGGKKVAVWGSGSKGVAFLTTIGITDEVDVVVDINPHRHGKFMPGIAKEIRSPEFLKGYRPDEVIVMNPIYVDEISTMLRAMGVECKVTAV